MGKVKGSRIAGCGDKVHSNRPDQLTKQILRDQYARPSERTKHESAKTGATDSEPFIDERLTAKILEEARKQRQELEEECGPSSSDFRNKKTKRKSWGEVKLKLDGQDSALPSQLDEFSDEDDLDSEGEGVDGIGSDLQDSGADYEPVVIDAEEEAALEKFMTRDPRKATRLADLITSTLSEKQTEISVKFSEAGLSSVCDLDPRVVEMYKGVGKLLAKYRSGKLPKAFKILPKIANWEQILSFTQPDNWTAAAMFQATRLFASNLNARMAQRFYNLVLLPRVRDDIGEYKTLNFHLHQALIKALYKPAAFFKGILLPLCESGTCTLREATIVSSVLVRHSVPMLHSAAAMLRIAEMDYSGGNSLFLRVLIDKKYTLPYRVIDGLVFHFLRFANDKRDLPVLWHQALLALCSRYKQDMSSEQREALLDLLKTHHHAKISPEIRRELAHAQCRDVEMADAAITTNNPDML